MMETSERVAWLSIIFNLVLAGIKAGLALLSGSIAVRADALHSLTDVLSSVFILIDILLTHQDQSGKGPAFVLGNGGVEILLTRETDYKEALAAVLGNMRKYENAIPQGEKHAG